MCDRQTSWATFLFQVGDASSWKGHTEEYLPGAQGFKALPRLIEDRSWNVR
jgi:hypothetical protein